MFLCVTIILTGFWNWRIFYARHTTSVPTTGGSISEGVVGQPEVINPLLATTPTDEALVRALFSGLYRYNEVGQIVPDLAAALPEISPDGKQYRITLQNDLHWHDGAPLTANDVLFTIAQIQNEAIGSPHREAWLSTTVQKIDDVTVVFTTKEVSGPFLHNLTIPLISERAWKTVPASQYKQSSNNLKPIGNGPFSFDQIKKNPTGQYSMLILKRFALHPRAPHIDELRIAFYENSTDLAQAFINGNVQLVGSIASEAPAELVETRAKQTTSLLAQYQAAFFNTERPVLKELAVRKALRMAVDSTAITTTAWQSKNRAISETPFGLMLGTVKTAQSNGATATQILENAGWRKNAQGIRSKGGTTLTLHLYTSSNPSFRAAAELLAETWKPLGVQVLVHAVPTNTLIAEHVRPREYDILLFSQRTSVDPDPFAFWHSSQTKDPGLNVSNFASNEADQLITAARKNTNIALRTPLYDQLKGLLDTQIPALYLTQVQYTYFSKDTITTPSMSGLPDPSWRMSFLSDFYAKQSRRWK